MGREVKGSREGSHGDDEGEREDDGDDSSSGQPIGFSTLAADLLAVPKCAPG